MHAQDNTILYVHTQIWSLWAQPVHRQDPVVELLRSAARSAVPTEEERRMDGNHDGHVEQETTCATQIFSVEG